MKVSFFETARYLAPQKLSSDWPVPAGYYDPEAGLQAYGHMIERIDLLEEIGFDWVSVSEHHYSPRILTPAPIISATFIAAHLKKLKVAVLGPIIPVSNPVRVAEELAMLDTLSQGRLVVGLLRGTTNELLTYDLNPKEARERTTEGMELLLKAWTEPQPFGWQGRHYQYRTVSVWPRPLQQPYPPTFALGTSLESCEFAAHNHLGLGASFAPYDLVCHATSYYRQQCAEEGWEPQPEQIVYRANILVAKSDEEAQGTLERQRGAVPFPIRSAVNKALMEQDRRNVAGVPRQPNVGGGQPTTFAGCPDTIVEQIKRARDEVGCGVIDFYFQNFPNAESADPEAMRHALETFGDKVLPRIRDV